MRHANSGESVVMASAQQPDWLRLATGTYRVLPDFIIIGAQKGGTSSLYHYLTQHPDVCPAFRKEVHYFDWGYRRGETWYRANFPTSLYRSAFNAMTGRRLGVGEASPYYLFHPHVPTRVKALLPAVKLIVLLRDPVERTVSSYQHQVRKGRESLSLAEALDREQERLAAETARIEADDAYNSEAHRHFSYLARGLYAEQLERWFGVFPRNQFLILHSRDFFDDTRAVFTQTLDFLGLRHWHPPQYRRFNAAEYEALPPATRDRLVAHFAPHNGRLYELLGRDFGWPR
jgi:hypothetical protein